MVPKRKGKFSPQPCSEKKNAKKAKKDDQVRVVHKCDTKYIVEANNVLKASHRKRIESTPFRWCLELDKALEVNCPLIREVLQRWVPEGEFIRVAQHLVRLSVFDVCISLGVSMVGKPVDFDNDVCGLVGSLFDSKPITIDDISKKISTFVGSVDDNVDDVCRLYLLLCFCVFYFPRTSRTVTNMPFKLLDNLENLADYNWADSIHTFLISGLNWGCKVVREKQNCRSLNISGCVAVLQVWVARRLGLQDGGDGNSFPQMLRWPDLKIRTANIEAMFESIKVVLDWSLSEEDNKNPIVVTALRIEGAAAAKHVESGFGHDGKVQTALEEKLKKNEMLIMEMQAEIRSMRAEFFGSDGPQPCSGKEKDLSEEEGFPSPQKDCQSEERNSFHDNVTKSEEIACSKGEDVNDKCDLERSSGLDVSKVGYLCPAHVADFDDSRQCVQLEESDHDDDKKANMTKISEATNIDDWWAIVPYSEGQTSTQVIDMGKLYRDVTAVASGRIVFAEINGQLLRSDECQGFRPRAWIDNMAVLFAASNFMYKERKSLGKVNRVIFSPLYTINRRVWRLEDYRHYIPRGLVSEDEILSADYLFAPVVYDGHWWCYAINFRSKKFIVLDSLGHKCRRKKQIDNHVMHNVEYLFWLLMNDKNQPEPKLDLSIEDLPQQPNLHDCGIIVLKYLQAWNGEKIFDGKSMPSYSSDDLQDFRQQFICEWLLDPQNIHRETVLQKFQPYVKS